MLKGRHFKALLLGAGLCAGLITSGCAGTGIDGGNLPGEVKSEAGSNTNANPNAPIAQQTFLIAQRNSSAPYTNVLTTQTSQNIDTLPNVVPTGPAGSLALQTQISNTTDPLFGRLQTTATAAVSASSSGLGTNWVATTPKPQPSVGQTSYYVYTVNGLQAFPQQVAAPTPAGAPSPGPSPIPIFNPRYIGDDSLSLGQIDIPNTSTNQALAANISFTSPPLANIVPTLVRYATGTRFYANYVHPSNKFMFVTVTDGVLTYRLEANGAITELARTSTGAGTSKAKAIAFSQNGNFMYVTCDSGHVAGFAITPQNGALTPVPGSPYQTDSARPDISGTGNITVNSLGVSFDRSGKFLYVVNQGVQTISGYSVNESTGALTPLPNFPLAAPQPPGAPAVAFPAFILNHPTKDVLYMTNMGPNAPVSRTFGTGLQRPRYDIPTPPVPPTVFTTDPNSGQLTLLTSNTLINSANRNSLNLAIDSAGRNLYITNAADPPAYDQFNQPVETRGSFPGGVTAFRINNDGSLTSEGSAQEQVGGDPNGILPMVIRNFAQ